MKRSFFWITALLIFSQYTFAQVKETSLDEYIQQAPFKMPDIKDPVFPNKSFNISQFGAVGDGHTLNTQAIQKTIDACANAGGGVVIVPPGLWLTAPVELKSNINFHLDRGAVLLFTSDHTQFPIIQPPHSHGWVVASPIYGYYLKNVAITGEGIIDGSGETWRPVKKEKTTASQWKKLLASGGALSDDGKIWWPSKEAKDGEAYLKHLMKSKKEITAEDLLPAKDYLRPYMVMLAHCDNVLIDGLTFKNSPKFAFYPNYCTNLIIRNLKINNEWYAQNGDGIDISACKNVILYRCTVNAGDDGICMKSSGEHGKDNSAQAALENVLIADCIVYHAHGGFVIGSNTDGGMNNIYVTNCDFINSDIGIRVKSRRGHGGLVHNIFINNIYMSNIATDAIYFNTYYENNGDEKQDTLWHAVNAKTPHFTDFHISNIYCDGAASAGSITGLPEMPVDHIYFTDMILSADKGFSMTDSKNIVLKDVQILPKTDPVYSINNCQDIDISDSKLPKGHEIFLKVAGDNSSDISVPANIKKDAVELGDNVNHNVVVVK